MTDLPAALLDLARTHLLVAGLVFLRIGAVMALLPGFGERVVPARMRLALGIAFTMIVAPAVGNAIGAPPTGLATFVPFLLAETLNGLCLGFILRLLVLAIEMAGGLAAQSGSLSQMFGIAGEPQPVIAHLLILAALTLAVLSGLHVQAARVLILSYEALPAGVFPAAALMKAWSVAHIAQAFALAFSLAAPFVIAALLFNVALGVINRAMPSLMVTFIGAPAMTAGALALLAIAAPIMLMVWKGTFDTILADPFRMPR